MNVVTRGIRNAFRNTIRTASIVVILGLSIGLALSMLVARQAVTDKITSVKSSVGNTIAVTPAGYNPMSQANNALTSEDIAKIEAIDHVSSVDQNLSSRLTTEGAAAMGPMGQSDETATTSLKSSVDLSSVNKEGGDGPRVMINGSTQLPSNFSLPVSVLGTTDSAQLNGNDLTIKNGTAIDAGKDTNEAMVSTAMAEKNNLEVGSTFTAYGETLTVAAIFESGTRAGDDTVVISLATLQRLSGQGDVISSATATVDSADNLVAATNAIKDAIGDNADVQSAQEQAENTIKPLENIQAITTLSLIGAIVAGATIILLTMIMIVRERRREIGVLKAIGSSNMRIMGQFMTEATTLTVLGAIVGIGLGALASTSITEMLVKNSSNAEPMMQGGGPRMAMRGAQNAVQNVTATVGWDIILYGLISAIVIAIVGSAIASYFISKVRPAEVMMAE